MKITIEIIGWIGALLIISAYALLRQRRTAPDARTLENTHSR